MDDLVITYAANRNEASVELEVNFLTVPIRQPGGLLFPRCRVTKVYGAEQAGLLDKYVSVFVNDNGSGTVVKVVERR